MKLWLLQLKNELWKMFARKRTYFGFVFFLAAESFALFLWRLPPARHVFEHTVKQYLGDSQGDFAQYYMGLTIGLLMVMLTFLLLGGLYLALVSGDMIAKEVEDGTLRMVLSRPISRLRIWFLKWTAASVYTSALTMFIGMSSLFLATIVCGGFGKLAVIYGQHPHHPAFGGTYETGDGLVHYVAGILLLALVMHAVSALAFLFSSFNMKPATASIATLSILFLDGILKTVPFFSAYQDYFLTYHLTCWIRSLIRPVPVDGIIQSLVYLATLTTVLLGFSAWQFCRRDFKS